MYPFAAGFKGVAGWNSENCGKCYKLTDADTGASIYVTAVDASPTYEFNLSVNAFRALFGNGIEAGTVVTNYEEADASNCKGNLGLKKSFLVEKMEKLKL